MDEFCCLRTDRLLHSTMADFSIIVQCSFREEPEVQKPKDWLCEAVFLNMIQCSTVI